MVQVRILAAEQQVSPALTASLAEQQIQHEQDDEQADEPAASLESVPVGQNQSDCVCHDHTSDARPRKCGALHSGVPERVNDTRRSSS
jgi:hypothetical protein